MEPWTPLIALSALSGAGVESWLHLRRLSCIPHRIHVNGTRGKSGVTRLIAAGLRAGGLRVIAKTTGAAPRLLLPDGSEVDPRGARRPSLREYRSAVRLAARRRADAVVVECMALRPEYQRAAERLLRSTIGVLTNVGLDHVGVMGGTLEEITAAFASTIPARGTLVTPAPVPALWSRRALALGTEVRVVTPEAVRPLPAGYVEWPVNVALALEVCRLLGVPRETALAGMRDVTPDPGALHVWRTTAEGRPVWLVGSFGANDPASTRRVIERVRSRLPDVGRVVGVLNTRADRGERTLQWCAALLHGQLRPDALVLAGPHAPAALRLLRRGGWTAPARADVPPDAHALTAAALAYAGDGGLVVGMGNMRGTGAALLEHWQRTGEEVVLSDG
ncbi:MAG: poly-gamma-glutamate synthase PgsB [Armatimonadota bacterium]|nr:poly-gamma-glutamate synthase PgsB [Armatimonadota bacterium]